MMEGRIIATIPRRIITFTMTPTEPFEQELIRWLNVTDYATVDVGVRVLRTVGIGSTETVRIFARAASQDAENDPATNYLGAAPLSGQPQFPQSTTTPQLVVEQFGRPYGSTLRIFIRGQTSGTVPVTVTLEFSAEFTGRVSS